MVLIHGIVASGQCNLRSGTAAVPASTVLTMLREQERHKRRDSRLECQMDSVLKLKTTEGREWPGLYACWPASLAILEYTGSLPISLSWKHPAVP
jgi:hypothetical protein